jgi:muramoyltetrapeptide carboxypeptidase
VRTNVATTKTKKSLLKPRPLKSGDRVALLCPSGRPETPAALARAERIVTEMGFKPVLGANVMSTDGYMAGGDKERLADFDAAVNDDSIAGIFCVSGGFGALHLLPSLDYSAIASARKLIVGCDDNTALLNAVYAKTGLVTMHAPNLDQISLRETFDRFKQAVTSKSAQPAIMANDNGDVVEGAQDFYSAVGGTAEGKLMGGNLTSFAALIGTEFEPDMRGSLLFFEDVNEQSGILDRWFTTLYLAGHLQYASGVSFGSFRNCGPKDSTNMLSVMELFADRLKYLSKTSCFGMPFGQQKNTYPVPIGIPARLDASSGQLEFLEPTLSV